MPNVESTKAPPTYIPECMRREEEGAIAMADRMDVRAGSEGKMH